MMRPLLFLLAATTGFGQPFSLTDSGPAAPDFQARFLGSYGVNEAIEPRLSPDDRALYERIAPLLRDQPREALAEVEAALDSELNPAFQFLRGNLYYQLDKLEEAEEALRAALEGFPAFRRAHRTLGLILIEQERFAEAVPTWLEVIQLGGGDAQSYGLLGYAYLSLEHYQSALVAYRNARMFRPDSTDFRRGEARSLLATDQLPEAIALFDELIAESPDIVDYWLLQANAHLEDKDEDAAIANLEIVRDLDGATPDSLRLLGDLYLRQGTHRLAVDVYKETLQRFGVTSFDEAIRPLDYLLGAHLFEEAEAYLTRLREQLPADLSSENTRRLQLAEAGIEVENEKHENARRILESVVETDPLAGKALLLLAEIHVRQENWPEAEFYLERARSLSAFQREALIAHGRMEVARGRFPAALEYLREARQLQDSANLARYIEAIERAL